MYDYNKKTSTKNLKYNFLSDLISVNNNLLFKLIHNYKYFEVKIVFL